MTKIQKIMCWAQPEEEIDEMTFGELQELLENYD